MGDSSSSAVEDTASVDSFDIIDPVRSGDGHRPDAQLEQENLRLKETVAQLTSQIEAMKENESLLKRKRERDEVEELTSQLATMQMNEKQMKAQIEEKNIQIERLKLREGITELQSQLTKILEAQVQESQLREELDKNNREIERLSILLKACQPTADRRTKRPAEEVNDQSKAAMDSFFAEFFILMEYDSNFKRTRASVEALNRMKRMYETLVNYRTSDGSKLCEGNERFVTMSDREDIDYYQATSSRVDLSLIREKLGAGAFCCAEELDADMQEMFQNVETYYGTDSEVNGRFSLIATVWNAIVGIELKNRDRSSMEGHDPTWNDPLESTARLTLTEAVDMFKRRHVIGKLVKAIFPATNPPEAIVQYAKKAEKELFEKTADKVDYYRLIFEKLERIQKEIQEKKAKRLREEH